MVVDGGAEFVGSDSRRALSSQALTNTARVVAFVQESGTGRVLGVATLPPRS